MSSPLLGAAAQADDDVSDDDDVIGICAAAATLSSWDGPIAVESTQNFCNSFLPIIPQAKHRQNGHAAADEEAENVCSNSTLYTDYDDDEDNESMNEAMQVAAAATAVLFANPKEAGFNGGRAAARHTRWRSEPPNAAPSAAPSASTNYYSSPNRSDSSNWSRQNSSRSGLSPHLRQARIGSSLLGDSITEIVLEDIPQEHEPTSALLDYCKRKFLRPFVCILSLVGLRPIGTDINLLSACFSYMKSGLILCILLCGYFLQYFCSYRGDRGFVNYRQMWPNAAAPAVNLNPNVLYPDVEPEPTPSGGGVRTIGELIFGYIVPSILHFLGFMSAVIVFKILDQEQLQNLIERVFINSMKPKHLCRVLWTYLGLSFVLLLCLLAYVTPAVLMQTQILQLKWLADSLKDWQLTVKLTLLATIFVQDLVEIIILSSYCIECYLLRSHLTTLSQKLLMHSIESLDWMREVLEFRKLLDHLNQRIAMPVCFFTVMNLANAFAGLVYLFKDFDFHYCAVRVVVLCIINVLLWLVMGLMPFFMAASVTRACQIAQANGHHIRVRPFVYHNTSADDLNSTLLFASSLRMSAKLFRMPIQPNYLCGSIVIVSIVVLTLGMCFNLSALGVY